MNFKKHEFASDLYRKGELSKIEIMEQLQQKIEKQSNNGLAGAFLTNGVYDKYDCIAMIANSKEYENKQGYILYDNESDKAIFVNDNDIVE